MVDWVTVMEEFWNVVIKETSKTTIVPPKKSNIQLMLLQSFAWTVFSQKKAKISTNLLAAAMHLAFLKSAIQNKLVIKLPDDPLALAQRFVSFTWITLERIFLTSIVAFCQVTTSLMMMTWNFSRSMWIRQRKGLGSQAFKIHCILD